MDYIAGDTLAERFVRYELKLSFSFVLGVMIDLCEVLIYLHAQNPSIVFRDLKPANVLLDRHNKAILVDFGIARRYEENRLSDTLQLGTPGFAAPEQLRGEQSDSRTDLYGLGALVYHLLSGGQFAIRHRGSLKRVLQDDVPTEFLDLLEQLLAINADERPQSAHQLFSELKLIQQATEGISVNSYDRNTRIVDDYDLQSYGNKDTVTVIALTSAYSGAGATFVSVALSASLVRHGIAHALVECPGSDSELFALLNGARRMPKGAVYAHAHGQQAAVPAWRNGKATYYPSDPNEWLSQKPSTAFASWLRNLGAPIVLLDVSSRWDEPEMMDWLTRSVDQLVMVVDCYPVKWSPRRQNSCMELQLQAKKRHTESVWLANRDQPFPDRQQWLSLFPTKPEVYFPDLSGVSMLNALWRGDGIPGEQQYINAVDKGLRKWISSWTR